MGRSTVALFPLGEARGGGCGFRRRFLLTLVLSRAPRKLLVDQPLLRAQSPLHQARERRHGAIHLIEFLDGLGLRLDGLGRFARVELFHSRTDRLSGVVGHGLQVGDRLFHFLGHGSGSRRVGAAG